MIIIVIYYYDSRTLTEAVNCLEDDRNVFALLSDNYRFVVEGLFVCLSVRRCVCVRARTHARVRASFCLVVV